MKAIIHKLIFRGNKLHRVEASHPWFRASQTILPVEFNMIAVDRDGGIYAYTSKPHLSTSGEFWLGLKTKKIMRVNSDHCVNWADSLCEIMIPELEHHHD